MNASERETDVMARKTVKIEIPAGKPEDLMTLAENLVEQHTELGKESPLETDRIKELDDAVKQAKANHKDFKKFDGQAQAARQARDINLGIEPGKSTVATVLAGVKYARKHLLLEHEGNEEKLSQYGFSVVVGTAKSPVRKNGNGQPH